MTPPRLIATGLGIGLAPLAPGTWGSALALPIAWLIAPFGALVSFLGAAILTAVGAWAVARSLDAGIVADPPEIVIDEVCAQWLVLAVLPQEMLAYLLGFIAFRIVDIAKPWPVGWADRNLDGALGVMADDLLAVPYAAAGAWLVLLAIGR